MDGRRGWWRKRFFFRCTKPKETQSHRCTRYHSSKDPAIKEKQNVRQFGVPTRSFRDNLCALPISVVCVPCSDDDKCMTPPPIKSEHSKPLKSTAKNRPNSNLTTPSRRPSGKACMRHSIVHTTLTQTSCSGSLATPGGGKHEHIYFNTHRWYFFCPVGRRSPTRTIGRQKTGGSSGGDNTPQGKAHAEVVAKKAESK